MHQLAAMGYDRVFNQLVDCLISIRTLGEVSMPISLEMFRRYAGWRELAEVDAVELLALLRPVRFAEQKVETLLRLARLIVDEHGGEVPPDYDTLVALPGVGPKCAHAVVALAGKQPAITVDTHVQRVVSRWGVVRGTAEQMVRPLQLWIPKAHWSDLNRLVQPFGKHICVFGRPKCFMCPLTMWCSYYRTTMPAAR